MNQPNPTSTLIERIGSRFGASLWYNASLEDLWIYGGANIVNVGSASI